MTEKDKQKIAGITKSHNIALMALFGSYATGHTHKKSDVDLGYASKHEIDFREQSEMSEELARVFKNPDIELVNIYNVAPDFKKQIADTGILLYEAKNSLFELFKIHANRTYIETKPLRVYRDARLKNFIQKYA